VVSYHRSKKKVKFKTLAKLAKLASCKRAFMISVSWFIVNVSHYPACTRAAGLGVGYVVLYQSKAFYR